MVKHPHRTPSLIFADARGKIHEYDGLQMAGCSAGNYQRPDPGDLIALPPGSELFALPGRLPVGFAPGDNEPSLLAENPFNRKSPQIQAVAAFVSPAHTCCLTASYQSTKDAPMLPLFAYGAVGWAEGKFWAACFRSDQDNRQDANQFDQVRIIRLTEKRLRQFPDNRLIQHLGKCCLSYGCPAARNYFLGRWEAPLPSSPVCNASCLGCISLQPSGCCPSPQERIRFVPTTEEIAAIAIPHLKKAPRAIVSFGQGCEGEPLIQANTLAAAITAIRAATARGTINCNTNGSRPASVAMLADAGLDSIRISLNSATPAYHEAYYRPAGFSFVDVLQSILAMKERGRFVSLNYFILPGFSDDPAETRHLKTLIDTYRPDLIQLRNLNMDPEYYLRAIGFKATGPSLGIRRWQRELHTDFPDLRFGYFNPPLPSRQEKKDLPASS